MALAPHPYSELQQGAGYYLEVLSRGHAFLAAAGVAVGLAFLIRGRREEKTMALFPILYTVLLFLFRSKYERFLLPVLVPSCALLPTAWERWGPRGPWKRLLGALAAVAILWDMSGHVPRPPAYAREKTGEREVLDWLARHAAPRSVILYESDALPLMQATFDPPGERGHLRARMEEAFREVYAGWSHVPVKAQFIGGVNHYSADLLRSGEVKYVVVDRRTRAYIEETRPDLGEVREFYRVLDEEGTIEFRATGGQGPMVLRLRAPDQLQ